MHGARPGPRPSAMREQQRLRWRRQHGLAVSPSRSRSADARRPHRHGAAHRTRRAEPEARRTGARRCGRGMGEAVEGGISSGQNRRERSRPHPALSCHAHPMTPPRTSFAPPVRPPLVPEDRYYRSGRAADALVRAAMAELINYMRGRHQGAEQIAAQLWPNDEPTQLVLRPPSHRRRSRQAAGRASSPRPPSPISSTSWGPSQPAPICSHGACNSASTALAAFKFPVFFAAAANVGFVEEGEPIPVRAFALDRPALYPRKKAAISRLYRRNPRLLDTERRNARQGRACRQLRPQARRDPLRRHDRGRRPPARTALWDQRLDADRRWRHGCPVWGSEYPRCRGRGSRRQWPHRVRHGAGRAVTARAQIAGELNYDVLASSGVAATTIIAIAPRAVVSAVDPAPRFEASNESTLHMDDAPVAIGTAGSPNVVGAPSSSLWQQNRVGLKAIYNVAWGLRHASGVAWMTGVTW